MEVLYKLPSMSPIIRDISPATFHHQQTLFDLEFLECIIPNLLEQILIPKSYLGSTTSAIYFNFENNSKNLPNAFQT